MITNLAWQASASRAAATRPALLLRVLLLSPILLIALPSCRTKVQNRPWGYFKLGKVQELAARPETYFAEDRLLLRSDARGLSVMSTACTYDLTALARQPNGEWRSAETTSRYAPDGKVLSGPAVADLPYYELKIDEGELNGPKDTLYVVVGSERPKDWRLAVPK